MEDIAQHPAAVLRPVRKQDLIRLLRRQRVDLLCPDPRQPAERSRVTAQMHVVGFIYNAAHESGDKGTACCHVFFDGLRHAFLHHVQHRRRHQIVFGQIPIRRDHIYGDIFLIKVFIIPGNLVHVF